MIITDRATRLRLMRAKHYAQLDDNDDEPEPLQPPNSPPNPDEPEIPPATDTPIDE